MEMFPVCEITRSQGIERVIYIMSFYPVNLHLPWPGRDKNISGFLFDAGSAEVFCTILHWCFPGLFPKYRCEITLTGKR